MTWKFGFKLNLEFHYIKNILCHLKLCAERAREEGISQAGVEANEHFEEHNIVDEHREEFAQVEPMEVEGEGSSSLSPTTGMDEHIVDLAK